jgi:hypothetical protein
MRLPRDIDDVEEFWKLLAGSCLVERDALPPLRKSYREEYLRATGQLDTVDSASSFLLVARQLTPWQCEKLRCGQWKGFFLEQYVIVDLIESNETCRYYLARQVKMGNYVRIAVKRRSQNGEGSWYRIE